MTTHRKPALARGERILSAVPGQYALGQGVQRHAPQPVVVELEQPGGVVGIGIGANQERDPVAPRPAVGNGLARPRCNSARPSPVVVAKCTSPMR